MASTGSQSSSIAAPGLPSQVALRKVVVLFRATGDAPILKQSKYKINAAEKFGKVIDFLRKQIHRDTVFLYINSAFSPNPDETVADLFDDLRGVKVPRGLQSKHCPLEVENNFGIDGKLVVNYASSQAWG